MRGNVLIHLGNGRARKRGAGNKGALLDHAAHRGISVPRGVLILDTAWDQAVLRGLMTIQPGEIDIPRPEKLLEFLHLPDLGDRLAVRSAFNAEDGASESLAGFFETVLDVDADDPAAIAAALRTVLLSAGRREGRIRRDVLVMAMVGAKRAGVAFTEHEHEDDLVNYTDGSAAKLIRGEISGESMALGKLRRWEDSLDEDIPAWARRVQRLMRDVRDKLGASDWDIEWIDDGQRCYLVQARPVTSPTRRDEAFTLANHKEILPELPSTFMTSLIKACANDLFDYYRLFDRSLPKARPLIEVFHGRPYINLSLLTEMMRVFGLPTRMVTDNLGGESARVYGLNTGRMLRKIADLTLPRFAWAQFLSVRHMERKTREINERLEDAGETFVELTDTLRWLYITLVTEIFSLTAATSPMLLLLRRAGVLEEHSRRQQTVSTRMFADLNALRRYIEQNPAIREALHAGNKPNNATFRAMWTAFLKNYGHHGIYESDIARPRYHEAPETLLDGLTAPQGKTSPRPRRSLTGLLTWPLWWQASRTIRARQQWRHDVMRGFDGIRQGLLAAAAQAVDEGLLPDVESLWLLTIDEVRSLDGGWQPGPDFFAARRAEIDNLRAYHLPSFFHRFDDLESWRDDALTGENGDHLHGLSLTRGMVEGYAWVLDEPAAHLPAGFTPEKTILVARSADAGWIPVFAQVTGAVIETGGDLSHGSIILRELGLPAVTNVHAATRRITTGDRVRLDAGNGTLHIIERVLTPDDNEDKMNDENIHSAQTEVIE